MIRTRHRPGTGRRRGFSLVELLISTAILGGALLVVFTLLTSGYRFAAELPGEETASNLSLSMLARYQGLGEPELVELVGMNTWVDPGLLGDATLDAADPRTSEELARRGHHRRVRFRRLPGDYGGIGIEGVVTWQDMTGQRRLHEMAIYFLPPRQWQEGMDELPGFESEEEEGWGHANGWLVETPEEVDGPRRTPEARARRRHASLEERIREVALARVEDRRTREPIRDTQEVRVRGGLAELPRLERGQGASRRRRDPSRELRDRQAKERFQERNRLDGLDWHRERVPDGVYEYLVDTLDLRARPDEDRVVGVYRLVAAARGEGGQEHLLVAQSVWSPERTWRVGGDEVLERRVLQAEDGRPWVLMRTVDRLYLLDRGRGMFGRRLEVRTLPCVDQTREGLAVNRRFLQARLEERRLGEATVELPDELAVAADERRLLAEGWDPESFRTRLLEPSAPPDLQ